MKLTLTAREARNILREHGMRISIQRLVDGIEDGSYPFGRIVRTGETGRRTVEILRKRLMDWIAEMEDET